MAGSCHRLSAVSFCDHIYFNSGIVSLKIKSYNKVSYELIVLKAGIL